MKFLVLISVIFLYISGTQAQIKTNQTKGNDMTQSSGQDSVTVAIIQTQFGDIEIELYTNDAPRTAQNFIELSKQGYFNGVLFHRIAKGFVIQGGDSTGTGAGGRSIYGAAFEDELNTNTLSYQQGYMKGVVAMANSGPNTNTSQFFIMLNDVPQLPKNYTIFGKVIKGMEVVDTIGSQEIVPRMGANDGTPVQPIKMEKVTIENRKRDIDNIFELK